ncbi:MAG: glycoside hydrolase family 3 N-terminal domain-containing protein [Carnobacterium sp.]|uniref:beta-N-acetylhexosaminidase n=1 Tax=Carnobacterium antarcticum TaxID=2126436 RepID=A0ABW4NLE1_9LACT|nr:glycoside hydrolase family 3 N-terminal domain-containing protein [Carnobacterium sp. CP1]ALV21636.1 Beta-hexosaminidase [Carnobacterium sp. CP1]
MQYKKSIIVLLLVSVFVLTACQSTAVNKGQIKEKETVTETKEVKKTSEIKKEEVKKDEAKETGEKLEERISNMSIEEKVGQLFLVRVPDVQEIEDVSKYKLGGYILFGKDFTGQNQESVTKTLKGYQEVAKIPLLIGVDQEGGTVSRLSTEGFIDRKFPSPQEAFNLGGISAVIKETNEVSQLLLSMGINLNFAPVADVATSETSFIADRTLGQDSKVTADYIKQVTETMNKNNIGSVLKHFPGYGDVEDTHVGIAYDNRPSETFEKNDFIPFEAGIRAGASMVLVSHNIVKSIDPEHPASLSPKVIAILREQLDYKGIIITDDLDMGGIQDFIDSDAAAVKAIVAGNDIVVTSQYQTQIPAVVNAVSNGTISVERLDESLMRVLELKQKLSLLD